MDKTTGSGRPQGVPRRERGAHGTRARHLGRVLILISCSLALASPAATYASSHLSAPTLIGSAFQAKAVSCPSSSFCAAVGEEGYASTFSGHKWSAATVVDPRALEDPLEWLASVSCVSRRFCVAVDRSGHALTYTGSSWSAPVDLGLTEQPFASVSCASSSSCLVTDDAGQIVVYNGHSWSAPTTIDSGGGLMHVACPLTRFCVAVDAQGKALTYNGRSWSAPTIVDAGSHLRSVSCPSARFCMALGAPEKHERETTPRNEVTFDGHAWSVPVEIPSSPPGIDDISCATPTLCVGVGFNSQVIVLESGSWSDIALVPDEGPSAVSCAPGSLCVILDFEGRAMTYSPRSLPPSLISPPFISGEAIVGRTLLARPGVWTAAPSLYLYSWGECDSDGANCEYLYPGEYPERMLFESDVGHTLRFEEWTLGRSGTGGPVISAPTCVVRTESEASSPPRCPPGASP